MKIIVFLFWLLILSSCSNCDCSSDNYNKLEEGQTEKEIEEIIGAKPVRIHPYFDWGDKKALLFRCEENGDSITVALNNDGGDNFILFYKKFN